MKATIVVYGSSTGTCGAAKELGIDYADGLMLLANWWGLLLTIAITAFMGYIGIRMATRCIKSN